MRRLGLTLAIIMLSACGGGSSPSQPSATPTLTITGGTDLLLGGEASQFSASQGTQTVSATWASSEPSVATVDTTGRAAGVGYGTTTISAAYQGSRSEKSLRVVPDYRGRWIGFPTVASCSATGDHLRGGFCDPNREGWRVGLAQNFSFTLSQNRDSIDGAVTFSSWQGSFQGTVGTDGRLRGNANLSFTSARGEITNARIDPWEGGISSGTMSGEFSCRVTVSSQSGEGIIQMRFTNLRR